MLLLLLLLAAPLRGQTIPAPRGFVTDTAGVIDAQTEARIANLLTELQQKTGAEIAVLTVASTAPLDDFDYGMRVADQWKVGRKGEDSGVLMLVAVQDRKIRVFTGYGVEGILPDGLVGAIQDQEMLPSFRAGNLADGIWRGVAAIAQRIAAARGVTLNGMPAPRAPAAAAPQIPLWVMVLLLLLVFVVMSQVGGGPRGGLRRGRRGPVIMPGGFGGGGGGGFGGFGGGGGGFGGFGGGGFGGGGAGRSW
ncbi:MAG: TPM domain-containing protein [Deltaproteobacteria bacterium]|nr:TPM domain-containing protein [Deltaproteobacteria bacterium]